MHIRYIALCLMALLTLFCCPTAAFAAQKASGTCRLRQTYAAKALRRKKVILW